MAVEPIPFPPSRSITLIEYDPETQQLKVTFRRGGVNVYTGVDETSARGFSQYLSATQYLNAYIVGQFFEQRIV
jgi:KTSC domain-containing protein